MEMLDFFSVIWDNLPLVLLILLLMTIVQITLIRPPGSPPGPINLPVVGYIPFMDFKRPYLTLTNLAKKYGPIYSLNMGLLQTVVLADEKVIRMALSLDAFTGRAPLYLTHGIMNGYGLICSEGALWKDQRRLVTSWLKSLGMVKFGSGRHLMETRIQTGIDEAFRMLDGAVGGPEVNPMHILQHSVGNIMNKLVFGVTWPEEHPTWRYLQQLQEEGVKHIGVSGAVNFLPFLRVLPSNRRNMKFILDGKLKTHDIYDLIINNHLLKIRLKEKQAVGLTEKADFQHVHDPELEAIMAAVQDGRCVDEEAAQLDTDCILNCFLKERTKREQQDDEKALEFCSDEQLRHLLADMFGAGVDTTVATLRWFLLFAACNVGVQNGVQEELDEVVGSQRPVCAEDLPNLVYATSAMMETQRIRSVVPLGIPHGTLQNVQLLGYNIPPGTMIIPLQWAVHMNPDKWDDPDIFNPGRFIRIDLEEKIVNFLPFQTGKRMCVGDELGRTLLYLFGAALLQRYDVRLSAESAAVPRKQLLEGECGITLTPPEHKLTFTKRANINF